MLSPMYLESEPLTCASPKRKQKFPKPFRKEIYDENLPKFVSSHNAPGMLHVGGCASRSRSREDSQPQSGSTERYHAAIATRICNVSSPAGSCQFRGSWRSWLHSKPNIRRPSRNWCFFKPSTPSASRTNALITTRTGHEVSLALVSRGAADRSAPVDYVLKYEPPRSFFIEASHPSFVIEETKSLDSAELPGASPPQRDAIRPEESMLRDQQTEPPHWEGGQLRVSVGRSTKNGDEVAVAFSVLNASANTIELLPPQIELTDTTKNRRHTAIKAEPVAIKSYRLTSRRLAPGERADGVVTFERPAFKASSERLMLQVAQVEQVDRPVLAAVSFVPAAKGGAK